jgi:hypothetical protein
MNNTCGFSNEGYDSLGTVSASLYVELEPRSGAVMLNRNIMIPSSVGMVIKERSVLQELREK